MIQQLNALREGLQADLGPQGFLEFLKEVQKNEDARRVAATTETEKEGGKPEGMKVTYIPCFACATKIVIPQQAEQNCITDKASPISTQ